MERVLAIFEEICRIPHGSGNCGAIAAYCTLFAERLGLWVQRDKADNVIIKKEGMGKGTNLPALILQAHLDMVCQRDANAPTDPETDGVKPLIDGDFLRAEKTTLGADDGIGVAMILAILEKTEGDFPPIEAVFTSDEETGMIGAGKLDMSCLSARSMINLDSEDGAHQVIVSCAGGSDVTLSLPLHRHTASGEIYTVTLDGLRGGHSGVDIDKGRTNAIFLAAQVLREMKRLFPFSLCSLCGGTKANAIPASATLSFLARDPDTKEKLEQFLASLADEVTLCEPDFFYTVKQETASDLSVLTDDSRDSVIALLTCAPDGVIARADTGVVTSLNLGILRTEDLAMTFLFSLRGNFSQSLRLLQDRILTLAHLFSCQTTVSGTYPPWPRRKDSALVDRYCALCKEKTGQPAKVLSIHAGLECGLFADALPGLDCLSIGPQLYDVHTPREALSLSSLKTFYDLLLAFLAMD